MTRADSLGVIVVAAGRSERMGFDKVWADLEGRPVLAWSIAEMARLNAERFVIVAADDSVGRVQQLLTELRITSHVVAGGPRRRDSVQAGLEAVADVRWVAIHDAARPLVSATLVAKGIEAARASGASVPAVPISDTVKRVDNARILETLDRSSVRLIQTPQVFRRSLLAWALSVTVDDVTDESGLIESLGGVVYTFPGQPENFKLTYPSDLALIREMIHRRAGGPELS
ncbi:MAG TPA: 2-C-methyl-D-erythritol 4-phosphate cytidylyltransferase [Chloroflexota bacterium]|nr:2-C-methyl-D-erythritol 4-phosphate cytidylyltransferase [Chloroflexota bacterium]